MRKMAKSTLKVLEKTIKVTAKKMNSDKKNVDANEVLALAKITKAYISLRKEIRLETATPQPPEAKPSGFGDGGYVDQMYKNGQGA